jgi:uncharacterized membrane protein
MKRTMNLLWLLVIATVILQFIRPIVDTPITVDLVVIFPTIFALIHGALRYKWRGMLVFLVVCLVVSNIFENLSILTGFPFGNYIYTDALGVKLFLVPILIGPAYFSTGYLAWVLATIIVDDVRYKSSWFVTFAVPLIASFLMVAWDLCFDPSASTLHQIWVWTQGGGYFGVPLSNYLGWYLVVYIFVQIFAIYLRYRPADTSSQPTALPYAYYVQALIQYAAIGVAFLVAYAVRRPDTLVTDPAGVVWHTASISESQAIIAIFTMIFGAILATVKLVQSMALETSRQAGSSASAQPELSGNPASLKPRMGEHTS